MIRQRARIAAIAAAFVLGIAGCGGDSPPGSLSPPGSQAETASPTASTEPGLVVDASLLDVLPVTVAGVALEADPETAATLIGDASLASTASAVAIARYLGPDDSSGDDLAIVSLVQLRPGVFGDEAFVVWRRDYDASACEPAGGVVGTEQATTIGTHAVFLGGCAGGVATYHTRLDGDILVSILAAGPRELGAGVIEGLHP